MQERFPVPKKRVTLLNRRVTQLWNVFYSFNASTKQESAKELETNWHTSIGHERVSKRNLIEIQ